MRWCLLFVATVMYRQNHQKFESGENFLQNGILHLGKANRQKLRWKVRIYASEKVAFQKAAWHLS